MVDAKDLEPKDMALIETIRGEIRALDFAPLDDEALAASKAATDDAVEDAASEGVHTTPRLAALHAMLIEERVPEDVRTTAVQRFMEAVAAEAKQP